MRPLVMGVLNVTPDSFSDGGRYLSPDAAVARGLEMVEEGADIVDVGGESSRPGAEPVPASEELRRVVEVVRALAQVVRVSIDTVKAEVAAAAIDAGATMLNDISASLAPVAAEAGIGWVAMHCQGTPPTMQHDPRYGDVVGEVRAFLRSKAGEAEHLGVGEIWVDPGFGFGKTFAHNVSLLAGLGRIVEDGRPVLVGTSRKSFVARLGVPAGGPAPGPAQRLEGSLATATVAMAQGAAMVRVHDVAATVQAAQLVGAPGGATVP
ncbi:MAG: dihydropteroate synthase [Acidimicrobiales bacterium]